MPKSLGNVEAMLINHHGAQVPNATARLIYPFSLVTGCRRSRSGEDRPKAAIDDSRKRAINVAHHGQEKASGASL